MREINRYSGKSCVSSSSTVHVNITQSFQVVSVRRSTWPLRWCSGSPTVNQWTCGAVVWCCSSSLEATHRLSAPRTTCLNKLSKAAIMWVSMSSLVYCYMHVLPVYYRVKWFEKWHVLSMFLSSLELCKIFKLKSQIWRKKKNFYMCEKQKLVVLSWCTGIGGQAMMTCM